MENDMKKFNMAYSVILVDDEELELNLLIDKVDWASQGFQVCAQAKNGLQALELISTLRPNVIITDVKMPVMDGVVLSRKVYEQFPNTVIAFLSGYNQFEYLKNALYVNAADYLLKPINFEEIPAFLGKLKKKCDELRTENLYQDEKLTLAIRRVLKQSRDGDTDEVLKALAAKWGVSTWSLKQKGCYAALASIDEYRFLVDCEQQGTHCIQQAVETLRGAFSPTCTLVEISPDKFLILSPEPVHIQELSCRWLSVCIVIQSIDIRELYSVFSKLEQKSVCRLYLNGPGGISLCQSESEILPKLPNCEHRPEFNVLLKAIGEGNIEQSKAWLRKYCGYISVQQERTSTEQYVVDLLDVLYSCVGQYLPSSTPGLEKKNVAIRRVLKIQSPVLINEYVSGLLSALIGQSEAQNPNNAIVNRICQYIEENYAGNISTEQLADEFNFSSNYLCTLFKKHVGKTVLEYITDVRLKRSIYLLQETSLRISQIASKVGYSTSSYFCAIFAKKYGISPAQYRSGTGK